VKEDTLDNHLIGRPSVVCWWWSDWIEEQEVAVFWWQVHLEVECAKQEREQLQQQFKMVQTCICDQIQVCKEWHQRDITYYTTWPWNDF